jgi:hypothetical protein
VVKATNQSSGTPLAGALISLRDSRDKVVLRVLADERGRAVLRAPGAGTYQVRADAIGYSGKLADPIRLDPAAPQSLTIALEPAPLGLNELVVTSSRAVVCNIDQAEGTVVARVWDEARKALTATTLTRSYRGLDFEIRVYDRKLDLRGRVMEETVDTKRGPSLRPFAATDPEALHQLGYVQAQPDGSNQYYGPDADLLLSERFLDDHCFGMAESNKDNKGRVGLSFTPIEGRRVSDIRGVLWLDERTMELANLEFGFTNVELPEGAREIGGRTEFEKLPNGGWIISKWHIRMPTIGQQSTPIGWRARLTGYREAAGDATLAGQPRVAAGPTAIVGTVFDSIAGAPLGGVTVSIQAGAFADTTDPSGRFRIVSPAVGQFLVTFDHPRFRLLGLDSVLAGAKLTRGSTDTVSVAIPGPEATLAKLCPEEGPEMAAIVGTVRDAATTLGLTATVVIRSSVISISSSRRTSRDGRTQRRVSVGDRGTSWEIETDSRGQFRVCGLPQSADLQVSARVEGRRPVERVISTETHRLAEVDLAVP